MNISRDEAVLSLSRRVIDARTLIICDPYILNCKETETENYLTNLGTIFPPSLKSTLLIFDPNKFKAAMLSKLLEYFPDKNIKAQKCDDIHDRVWIINGNSAFTTGTSLNSIGYKLSFIQDLPVKDFNSFWDFLVDRVPEVVSYKVT